MYSPLAGHIASLASCIGRRSICGQGWGVVAGTYAWLFFYGVELFGLSGSIWGLFTGCEGFFRWL
ncbi:hypothetical protein BDZ45DRAFT_667776, partial [Acephala macrosclerotiorum]